MSLLQAFLLGALAVSAAALAILVALYVRSRKKVCPESS